MIPRLLLFATSKKTGKKEVAQKAVASYVTMNNYKSSTYKTVHK